MKRMWFFMSFLITTLRILLSGGTTDYQNLYEADMYHQHPVDQLVLKKLRTFETDKIKIRIAMNYSFSGNTPLYPHAAIVQIPLKKLREDAVEKDFIHFETTLLRTYNNIRQIRPYLSIFPVPSDAYNMSVSYGTSSTHHYSVPYYSLIQYWHVDRTVRFWQYQDLLPGELALPNRVRYTKPITAYPELVTNIDLKLPRTQSDDCAPIIIDSIVRQDGKADPLLLPISRRMCKKHGLHISSTRGCDTGFVAELAISPGFWSQEKEMNLEEARKFAVQFFEEYITEIRNKKVVEKTSIKTAPAIQALKENLNWFCFRITFWDKWLNRVDEPYIAQIQCENGKLIYYRADDGQRLYQVLEEPVPEKFFPKSKITLK